MKSNLKNKIKYVVAVIMVSAMILTAELFSNVEIIFPEIAALIIGSWLVKSQPWNVNRIRLILLMSISAFVGVLIVKYVNIPTFLQILLALIFAAIALTVSGTDMVPMISACVLPVIMKTDTFIYSISVVTMTVIVVTVRIVFEKIGLCDKVEFESKKVNHLENLAKWLAVFAGVSVMAIIALNTHNTFFIAPPLIVTYVILFDVKSLASKNPIMVFLVIMVCSIVGALARMLSISFGVHATIVGALAMIAALLAMYFMKFYFPPAGAIAILPLIIKSDKVLLYPIQIVAGCAAFIFISEFVKRKMFKIED